MHLLEDMPKALKIIWCSPSLCLPFKSHARNFMFLAFYLECNHLQNDISTVAAHCPQLCVVSPLIHKDPLILFVQPQDYLKRSLNNTFSLYL